MPAGVDCNGCPPKPKLLGKALSFLTQAGKRAVVAKTFTHHIDSMKTRICLK